MEEHQKTSLDEVRQWIDVYGKKVANLRDQKKNGIEVLQLREAIQDALEYYLEKGACLDSELTRLGNHDGVFQNKASFFVRMVGKPLLASSRSAISPPPSRWWWFLDQKVGGERRRKLKKNLKTLTIGISVFLVVYFVFLRLPPDEKLYHETLASLEHLADDYIRAQTPEEADLILQEASERSLSISDLFADRPSPFLIAGVVQDVLGNTQTAESLLESAAIRYENRNDYRLEKAGWYIRLGRLDQAYQQVSLILEDNGDHVGGWNLRGMIYEMEERIPEALITYERVLELAEEQNVITLIPVTRMKMAMLQLRLPSLVP